ncbi:AAA family ATPase [Vibrio sp. V39_P1S14PM300]|nr:AAA family ATPase [Vibrio sp. V39_P1S14PM300]
MKPVIISGGPGAGKTSLIRALGARGIATFEEASRRLIEQQSRLPDGILPWDDLPGFARLCFDVIEVPFASLALRARFVIDVLGLEQAQASGN